MADPRSASLFGAATDVGCMRQRNEDSALIRPGIYVVADGMGGHMGGDVASRIAVEEVARAAEEVDQDTLTRSQAEQLVVKVLARAQARLQDFVAAHPVPPGMGAPGTTVVIALELTGDDSWLVANVGDSRAYHLGESGALSQVTQDHSVVGDLVARGLLSPQAAAHHPERHVITRALSARPIGAQSSPRPDFFTLQCQGRLLLCTDGVNDMLSDPRIAELLGAAGEPHEIAERLVAAAVSAGGQDNATAVVIEANR